MDILKDKKEKRSGLLAEMQSLFDKVETEKRDFTKEEQERFDVLDKESIQLDAEILNLEKMEGRKAQIAIEERSKAEEAAKVAAANAGAAERSASVKTIDPTSKVEIEKRNVNTFKMLRGVMSKNPALINEARKSLAEGGHYDDLINGANGEKRGFDTLVDTNGAVLIPTSVSSQVMDIMQNYGVVPRLALNLGDISQNNVKIPQILGRPSFAAVSQGGAITGSGFNLGAIELKALKWGAILNWTNEVSDSVASRLMPIIMNKVAEGFAYAQDDAFFNGDGTSTYNGIRGLEGLTGTVDYVRTATAPSGNVSFATLDADDFLLPQQNVAPGTRSGSVYVMHPNLIFTLRKLKDGQGKYIYGDPSEMAPVGTLFGHKIELSEAFAITDAVTSSVCAFFNPGYLAYATGRNLSADQLAEGTIVDEDSVSINLATTDQKALRFTGLFDLVIGSVTRTTGSAAQGAFSVLRTAAS